MGEEREIVEIGIHFVEEGRKWEESRNREKEER